MKLQRVQFQFLEVRVVVNVVIKKRNPQQYNIKTKLVSYCTHKLNTMHSKVDSVIPQQKKKANTHKTFSRNKAVDIIIIALLQQFRILFFLNTPPPLTSVGAVPFPVTPYIQISAHVYRYYLQLVRPFIPANAT